MRIIKWNGSGDTLIRKEYGGKKFPVKVGGEIEVEDSVADELQKVYPKQIEFLSKTNEDFSDGESVDLEKELPEHEEATEEEYEKAKESMKIAKEVDENPEYKDKIKKIEEKEKSEQKTPKKQNKK